MYVKNFNFLFKSMFLRKNGRIEKNWNSFAAAPPEKQAPLIDQTPSRISAIVQHPPIIFLKKEIRPSSNLKWGEAQKTKHSIGPRVFFHILVYISTVYTRVELKDTHYSWGSL